MTVVRPEHLFEQADQLLAYRRPRHPSQADLRRAISASYYGVFHLICTDAADLFANKTQRHSPAHTVVYRSLDHGQLRRICIAVQSPKPDNSITEMLPKGGFRRQLVEFAAIALELQTARNRADYDPSAFYSVADARAAIQSARDAVVFYKQIVLTSFADRLAFLTLLMFKRR